MTATTKSTLSWEIIQHQVATRHHQQLLNQERAIGARSVFLTHPRYDVSCLITMSVRNPGEWQLTSLDSDLTPCHHTDHPTMADAVKEASYNGYRVTQSRRFVDGKLIVTTWRPMAEMS